MLKPPRLGLGCLHLPAEPEAAAEVIGAALAGGVRLFDTADVYGAAPGDGEKLVAQALAALERGGGARAEVAVATKVGLVRQEGRWTPDGRARSLAAASEASCRRLGVARLDL